MGDAKSSVSHEVSLHVSFVHAIINPLLFLLLHKPLRTTLLRTICCIFAIDFSERNKRQRAGENIMNPEEIRNGIDAENAEINGAISNGHQLLGVNKNILSNGFVFRSRKET